MKNKLCFTVAILLLFVGCTKQVKNEVKSYCVSGDCVNGIGTYNYSYGGTYTGEFKDGKKNGQGVETFLNGTKISGKWIGNEKNGPFVVSYSNGEQKIVEYENGKPLQHAEILKGIDRNQVYILDENNFKNFYEAHFNPYENKEIYNTYSLGGDEFTYNKKKDEINKIKGKKYLLCKKEIGYLPEYNFRGKYFTIGSLPFEVSFSSIEAQFASKSFNLLNNLNLKIDEENAQRLKSSYRDYRITYLYKINNFIYKTIPNQLYGGFIHVKQMNLTLVRYFIVVNKKEYINY